MSEQDWRYADPISVAVFIGRALSQDIASNARAERAEAERDNYRRILDAVGERFPEVGLFIRQSLSPEEDA